jgi:DNA-binding CsgD family transcriptional regulator
MAEFIRMGKSSRDIAEALDIARKTVWKTTGTASGTSLA